MESEYSFQEVWDQIKILQRAGVGIVPVVGYRNPRWPERHGPNWLQKYTQSEFEQRVLDWVERCVREFQSVSNIIAWQVENEPFDNHWGEAGFDVRPVYSRAIDTIRSMDPRPCLVSYGFQPWKNNFGDKDLPEDIVGLDVYTKIGQKILGVPMYPDNFLVPFADQRLEHAVARLKRVEKEVWITELQAEPWDCVDGALSDRKLWERTIHPKRFARNIQHASRPGVSAICIWGVEWWYTLDTATRQAFLAQL